MLAPTIIPTSPPLQCKNVAHFLSQEFLGKVKGLHCFLIDYYLEKPAKKCLKEEAIQNTLFSLFLRPSSELSFLTAGGRWVQGLILPIFFLSFFAFSVFIQAGSPAPFHGGELVTSYVYAT